MLTLVLLFLLGSAAATAAVDAIPTFHSMGLYWTPRAGSPDAECKVRYRVVKSNNGGEWKAAQSLWFDRKTGQYRGSVVHLQPGTNYEFRLELSSGEQAGIRQVTWPEAFPVARTVELPRVSSGPIVIREGGSSGAYVMYTASKAGSTVDVADAADYCIDIQASYVIVRGIVCRGARKHGIHIDNRHDIVIEGCDISRWGRRETRAAKNPYPANIGVHYDSGIYSDGPDVERIVVQGNRIHHPRYRSSNWTEWSPHFKDTHPQGPKGVIFWPPTKGNHVIRYNEFYGDTEHMFNDILFESYGGRNSPGNGLVRDSDIYGNILTDCWDDAIEIERGDRNVRLWDNYFSRVFKAISAGWIWEGPAYIWRNVSDIKLEPHKGGKGYDVMDKRVPTFLIPQQESETEKNSTIIYMYHNTVLCLQGACDSLAAGNGVASYISEFTRLVSRNNIFLTEEWAAPEPGLFTFWGRSGKYLDEDYDLHNGDFYPPETRGRNAVKGWPVFREYHGSGPSGQYQLAPESPGFDAGQVLPNFNDGFSGRAPDIGAHEGGAPDMRFGVKNWKPATRPARSKGARR